MREIRIPIPVKLFIGMLSPEPALFGTCADIVCREYGRVDYQSEIVPWTHSDFYQEEMGPGILRKFIFFERLMDPGDLSEIKIKTTRIENSLAVQAGSRARRRINLDPGYVTEAKVVLATTKDYSHRLYIGNGIYAEVTLRYGNKDRSFTPFDHTYLDYGSETYRTMFNKSRELLRTALQRPVRR
jgi:Domain of unknown function (DUF4416)